MIRWIFLIFLLLLQTACDTPADKYRPNSPILNSSMQSQQDKTIAPPSDVELPATTLLGEPTPVYRFETTAEALSVWRRAGGQRPTLLLLSNNPHLVQVPQQLRKPVAELIVSANAETLAVAATDRNPKPLLMPGMAVDAALRSDWFHELVWVLPLRDSSQDLSLEKFREQLTESRIATDNEAASLTLTENIFHGSLRDTAFTAATLPLLHDLPQPVIVHIELSYFQPLYKNEIATPLLDIVLSTLNSLQEMNLQTLAVTFSYGHLDNQISLDVRFLGDIIAYLIEDPARLDQPIPINWQRQRDALYLANFFKKEKIRELYEAQEQTDPGVAWIKFNLYRSAAEHKEGNKALDYLAQAVALNSVFALEYLELSKLAYERERPDEALRMLKLAADSFQNDPFIKLQIVQLADELGEKEAALHLLKQLSTLDWSETYYQQMPQYLSGLTSYVQSGETQAQGSSPDSNQGNQGGNLSRQKTLHAN